MTAHDKSFLIDGVWYSAETRTMRNFWSVRGPGGQPMGEIFRDGGRLTVHGKRVKNLRDGVIALRDRKADDG